MVVLLSAAAFFLLPGQKKRTSSSSLDISVYLDNASQIRGNTYGIEGEISELLSWSEEKGRLVSFKTDFKSQTVFLPIYLPPEFSDLNVQKGQRYQIKAEIIRDGFIQAREIDKS